MNNVVQHLNVTIDEKELERNAVKIIGMIRPDWDKTDVCYKTFTEGLTNKLLGCYYAENTQDMILIRVFGNQTEAFIDRDAEIKNFKLMNSAGYAPRLYLTFNNGMAYDFTPGVVLNIDSCRESHIYPLVATMMAKMHKLSYSDGTPRLPLLWDKCETFLTLISSEFLSKTGFVKHHPEGWNLLQRELEWIENSLKNVDSPVVFCHNDLLLANVIYNNNMVTFIDYEYAGYNYQAFDIANHFAEFSGVSDKNFTLYPSESLQKDWVRYYLIAYNGEEPCEKDVTALCDLVRKFVPVAHFMWTLWALVQMQRSSIDFNYLEFALMRLREYIKRKSTVY